MHIMAYMKVCVYRYSTESMKIHPAKHHPQLCGLHYKYPLQLESSLDVFVFSGNNSMDSMKFLMLLNLMDLVAMLWLWVRMHLLHFCFVVVAVFVLSVFFLPFLYQMFDTLQF